MLNSIGWLNFQVQTVHNCPIQRRLLGSQLTKLFAALPTFIVAEAALHAEDGRCRGEGGG